MNTTAAVITRDQANTIARQLREAGMDVQIRSGGRGPIFTNCTGTNVLAAVVTLVNVGELPLPFLTAQDWLTVSFEETVVDGHWSSIELEWVGMAPVELPVADFPVRCNVCGTEGGRHSYSCNNDR